MAIEERVPANAGHGGSRSGGRQRDGSRGTCSEAAELEVSFRRLLTDAEAEGLISRRRTRVVADLRARMRSVCASFPAERFNDLVERMADIHLAYEGRHADPPRSAGAL